MKNNKLKIAYWILTLLFLLPSAGTGFPELFSDNPGQALETIIRLGYPAYLLKILGFSKIMGFLAIITNRFPRLKEWAYAGFAIDFLGGAASHILAGDAAHAPIPFAMFVIMMSSYVTWRKTGGPIQARINSGLRYRPQ